MRIKTFRKIIPLGVLVFGLNTFSYVNAQVTNVENYPSKTIEIIVGAGAGGGIDNFARATSDQLAEKLGAKMKITNQAQASGAIANRTTANNPPDGHTLNYISSTFIVSNASGENKTGLDQLTPVARMQSDILAIFVSPKKYESFEAFKADAEEKGLRLGGTHALSPDAMGFYEFRKASGLSKLHYIAYDGTSVVQAAVMGGTLDAYVGVLSAAEKYIESGDLKPIIIFTEKRLETFPETPVTVDDFGWDVTNGNERGVLVHKDTPQEIIEKLESTLKEIFDSNEYQQYAKKHSLTYRDGWMGSKDYLEKLKNDEEKFRELIKEVR